MNNAAWPSVLPSIIDAAERDPEIARLQTSMHAGNMQPFFDAIAAARRRGELARNQDPDTMIAAIVGPLFYRRWFSKEEIDEAFLARVIGQAIP